MRNLLFQIFTWWNGQTMGTRFFTWRKGQYVGEDEFGNKYYRATVAPLGERRWVIYNGEAEPSSIPTGWHGWMHHKTDIAPTDEDYSPHVWQKPHRPNPTGTVDAYRPKGSILVASPKEATSRGYSAWTP